MDNFAFECTLCGARFVKEHFKDVHVKYGHLLRQKDIRDETNNSREKEKLDRYLEEYTKTEKRCKGCEILFTGSSGIDSCIDCRTNEYKYEYGEEHVKKTK